MGQSFSSSISIKLNTILQIIEEDDIMNVKK